MTVRAWRRSLVVALLCAAQVGCLGVIVRGPGDVPDAVPALQAEAALAAHPLRVHTLTAVEEAGRHYRAQTLQFIDETPGSPVPVITARHYRGSALAPRPLLILVPVWGDGMYSYPSASLSRYVQRRARGGIDVLHVAGTAPLVEWGELAAAESPAAFETLVRETVDRYRATAGVLNGMVDWVAGEPELDGMAVAIAGFSIGAVAVANALGSSDRFAAGVLVMGAADLGSVFANCRGRTGSVRDGVRERFGWSAEEYETRLGELLRPIDPLRQAMHFDPQRTLLLDATLDRCIPGHARQQLWHATGQPRRISFIAPHRMAFLSQTPLGLQYGNRQIYRFLRRHLIE